MKQLFQTFTHLFHPQRSNNHRPRVLHPEAFAYLSLIIIGFALSLRGLQFFPGWGDVLGFASSITPSEVIELTNQQRTRSGLDELVLNQELTQAALAKAQDMLSDQYWAHTAPDGVEPWYFMRQAGYDYQVAGENLARDFVNTEGMTAAWMASPTHRANIMNTKYQEIGIAVIDGKLEGYETTVVVQMFGRKKSGISGSLTDEALTQESQLVQAVEVDGQNLGIDTEQQAILASALITQGSLETLPFFTPLQLTKAFFLGMIILITLTLTYDAVVIGHRKTMRIVGKNLAHIMLFIVVAFLMILFKGGIVG